MTFEIVNKKGDLIHNLELDHNPFKVGEVLHLDIRNHDTNFWKGIKEFRATSEITKIEHYYKEIYGNGGRNTSSLVISITVFEIDYEEL